MYFKREYRITSLFLRPDAEPLQFSYKETSHVDIILQPDPQGTENALCTAITQQKLAPGLAQKIESGQAIRIEDLPFFKEHESYVSRTVNLVRWRLGAQGPHDSLRPGRLDWSNDGKVWTQVSCTQVVSGDNVDLYSMTDKARQELENLVEDPSVSILGHELFREAWQQRYENPRSALVIGIAAAECGLKQFIMRKVTGTEWLLQNLPSPPLDKILTKYLPQLTQRQGKNWPKSIVRALKEGIEERNGVIHIGEFTDKDFPYVRLEEILLAVRDLLYILDYYCDFKWALDHVRPQIRQEL